MTEKKSRKDEALARAAQSPEHQRLLHPGDADPERQAALDRNRRDEAALLADLRDAGGPDVRSVAEVKRLSKAQYRKALPVLLAWLRQTSNPDIKRAVVGALATKSARPDAAPVLVEEFTRVADGSELGLAWNIANALSYAADDSVFDDVARLARDPSYGRDREMLAVALGGMRDPRAVDVLIELLDDDDVAGHAVIALGTLKAIRARAKIEPFLQHPKPWVRKEAKKALEKTDMP
jgi:HEAT repeat protein